MRKSEPPRILPRMKSLDEIVSFFDSNDMGEYWENMPEAHFDINVNSRKYLVRIDEELVDDLSDIAKSKRVSPELLINTWIKEKILESRHEL